MREVDKNTPQKGGAIYTLAQSGTSETDFSTKPNELLVYGIGSDLENKKQLFNKAKRKYITNQMTLRLVDIANEKGDKKRAQQYWNTYHCQKIITSANGKYFGNYCKNRCCLQCCAIRKAEIINRYLPIISTWEDAHFVTLTVKAVPKEKLRLWFRAMKKAIRLISDRNKKRHKRGKAKRFKGIKSLECNFNPEKKTYNPHFHLIVDCKQTAVDLILEWEETWTKKDDSLVDFRGQDMKPVYNTESILIEVIKYGSKIFTEPDVKKKKNSKIPPMIYAQALDNIFEAMSGYRLFDRFGFNLPKKQKVKINPSFISEFENFHYDAILKDWVNLDSGELLTQYTPTSQLDWLINHNINTDLK